MSNSYQWRIQDFPLGGRRPVRGHQPPTHTLFGENVCENERNGSCWGAPAAPPGSANANVAVRDPGMSRIKCFLTEEYFIQDKSLSLTSTLRTWNDFCMGGCYEEP